MMTEACLHTQHITDCQLVLCVSVEGEQDRTLREGKWMLDKYLLHGLWKVIWLGVIVGGETKCLVLTFHCIVYYLLHLQLFFPLEDSLNLNFIFSESDPVTINFSILSEISEYITAINWF